MTKITLQSPGKQHLIQAVPVDPIFACESTSAPDVYVGGVTAGSPVHNLQPGDSMLAPKGTLSMYLFRKSQDVGAFSATLDLSPAPVSPNPPHPGLAASGPVIEQRAVREPLHERGARTGGLND